MSHRRWLVMTLLTMVGVAAVGVATMLATDVYGLFRQPTGRRIPIFYADRNAKFLLSQRYVPTNFNGLLIGPSSSMNWDLKTITQGLGVRLYNESLEGGNATEEKLLAEQALKQGSYRLALVVLYPTMVSTHTYEDGVDKTRWTEALGSLDAFVQTALAEMNMHHISFPDKHPTDDGSHEMPYTHRIHPDVVIHYTVDPTGLQNLQTLTSELQARGIQIVYVVPTLYEPMLEKNWAYLQTFKENIRSVLPPGEFIDLNGPEYKDFRSNPSNYIDGFHVTPQGALGTSEILNARLRLLFPTPVAGQN